MVRAFGLLIRASKDEAPAAQHMHPTQGQVAVRPMRQRGPRLLVEDVGADEFEPAVAIEVHGAARGLWLRRTEKPPKRQTQIRADSYSVSRNAILGNLSTDFSITLTSPLTATFLDSDCSINPSKLLSRSQTRHPAL